MARYELLEEVDFPFPLGGCFGYWGYDLKNFVEPKLSRRAVNDLELPDCQVGFYDSLVVFDHRLGKQWIVSTGLCEDGSREEARAERQGEFWAGVAGAPPRERALEPEAASRGTLRSSLSRDEFLARVERALAYIRAGDIYQVNLSHRLAGPLSGSPWSFFQDLTAV